MAKYTDNIKLETPEYTDDADIPKLMQRNNKIIDNEVSSKAIDIDYIESTNVIQLKSKNNKIGSPIQIKSNLPVNEFLNGTELKLKNYKELIKFKKEGKSVQDEIPTPTNPQEIKNIKGNNGILKLIDTSENLLSITQNTFVQRGQIISGVNTNKLVLKATNSDIYVNLIVSANATYNVNQVGNFIPVKKGDKLYFDTGNELFINNYFTLYDKNKVSLGYSSMLNSSNGGYEITNENCEYVTFRFGYINAVANQEYTLAPIVSKEPIDNYKSYERKEISINLQKNELCSTENIKDELIVEDSKAKMIKNIKELVLTGNEDWEKRENVFNTHVISDYKKSEGITTKCNYYKSSNNVISSIGAYNNGNNTISLYYLNNNNTIYIRDDRFNNANDFKTFLQTQYNAGTPVIIQYELEESETIELGEVNFELIDGDSILTCDEESNMEIEYLNIDSNVFIQDNLNGNSAKKAPSVDAVKRAIPTIQKIWENSDTNNTFKNQIITINNLSEYDFIILFFYNYTINKAIQSVLIPVVNDNKFNMACTIYNAENIHFGSREGVINTSNNTITFEQCHGGYISSTGTPLIIDDNNWNIPYQIYGYSISR